MADAEHERPGVLPRIWAMEDELGLHARRIGGVAYWPLFRFELGRLLRGSDMPLAPPLNLPARLSGAVRSEIRAWAAPSWSAGPVASIVAPFHRKVVREGQFTDRLLEGVLGQQQLGPFLVLENLLAADRIPAGPGRRTSLIDKGAALSMALGWLDHRRLLDETRAEHAVIDASHRRLFGAPYPLSAARMAQRIRHHQVRRRDLAERLRRTGARRLFVTYHLPVLFDAAKAAGLQVIEVQHGAITRQSLQYHYPGSPPVDYFPDQLWMFGPFWPASIELPANCRPAVTGSAAIEALRARRTAKVPRSVLVASHLPNDGRLFDKTVQTARAAPDWTFVFRPHPEEDFAAYEAKMAGAHANLRLSPPSESVYGLLETTEVLIGVNSTTLFEGMALGARTIVVDLPGAEMLAQAVRAGDAVLASPDADLADLLAGAPKPRSGDAYFSPPASAAELRALLGLQ